MSIEAYPSPNGVLTSLIWRKTMSGGETSLSGYDNASQALSYTPGQEQVYLNGILLVRGDDYTATNGTSITGLTALAASDFVQINCYNNFSVATLPTSGLTGTISNAQLQNSAITINGSAVSLGGTVTLAGDIESVTAGTGLTGGGSTGAVTLGLSTPVATTNGGTGLSTFTTGDLVYASAADTLGKRSIGTTGQVLTVSGGLPTWATPASTTPTFVGCSVYGNRTVLMSNGATTYAIPFNAEYFDTDGFHDNATNNTRVTIPTGKGGKYQINVQIAYDNASGTPGYLNWFLRIDGSGSYSITTSQLQNTTPSGISGSTNNSIVAGSAIVSFNAGQYFEVLSRTDNGNGNIYATPYVTVAYLGA